MRLASLSKLLFQKHKNGRVEGKGGNAVGGCLSFHVGLLGNNRDYKKRG